MALWTTALLTAGFVVGDHPIGIESATAEVPLAASTIVEEGVGAGDPVTNPISADLGGLEEADEADSPFRLVGESIHVLFGPVLQAHLLLPERIDPFADHLPAVTVMDIEAEAVETVETFELSEQRRLLGVKLAPRIDTPDEKAAWRWQAEAGGSFRQGNTTNTNLRGGFDINRKSLLSVFEGKLGTVYNRNGDNDPNLRAFAEAVLDRNLRGSWLAYVREEAEYDEAKRIDLRSVTSSGLGFKFVDRLHERLVARTGPTFSYIDFDSQAATGDESLQGWLVESEYRRLLGESTRFEHTAMMLPDFDSQDRFRIINEGALLFPIGGAKSPWNWRVGLRHQLEKNAARNTRRSDLEGYFSITYHD